jgi:putative acetyltransferase
MPALEKMGPASTEIRPERPADVEAIAAVTRAAFAGAPHRSGTEAAIVDALRAAGALTLSLVATEDGRIVGHAAFSPVGIAGGDGAWFGLGPVSVEPSRQRRGIGRALVTRGLERLRELGASGCVVLGDPAYYGRFGFASDGALSYRGLPPQFLQRFVFRGSAPAGEFFFHSGFDAE